jgi:hypothetical protein
MSVAKRAHPSGYASDRYPYTGTPEARALAKLLREHSRLPDMNTRERGWSNPEIGVTGMAWWERRGRYSRAGWCVNVWSDSGIEAESPGRATSLRIAFRAIARRLEGRPVVLSPRQGGWGVMSPAVRAEFDRSLAVDRALHNGITDPHRIPLHRPGRPDHLRDLIAKWHRTA